MARKRKRNVINVEKSRKFLWEAYGFKSKEVTPYEILILHEEYRAKFNWYHTKGTLFRVTKHKKTGKEVYKDFTRFKLGYSGREFTDAETVAVAINKLVSKHISNPNHYLYWDKGIRHRHQASLEAVKSKIYARENTGVSSGS